MTSILSSQYISTNVPYSFVLILLISEGQAAEAWKTSNKPKLFLISGSSGRNVKLISAFKVA
jgi:hypothetical protein